MPHQIEGIDWMSDLPRTLLADEAGLGKTAQLLKSAVEPVVVVAPAMVLASGTWDDEVEKWAPGIDITPVAYSSLAQRGPRGSVPRDANGFPLTPPKPEYVKQLRHGGTLILDESHYIKGRKTNWSTACEELAQYADVVRQATGTPIPNWANEAYMALRVLRPGDAKPGKDLGSYWRWVQEWFEVEQSRWNPRAREIKGLQEHLTWDDFYQANWDGRMLLRLRDEVLKDLPPLTWTGQRRDTDPHEIWRVDMTKTQAKAYRDLRRDFITWLEGGEEIAAWSTPGLLVKLAKCATGLESLSDGGESGSGKMDALRYILTDRPRQTLVVAHFRSSVEACARVSGEVGKSAGIVHGGVPMGRRKDIIRRFQEGLIDTMCASIDTISEGMTLHQGGADQVVRVERSWLPSKNEQVIRRLHRIGQTRPVSAIDLVTRGTVDERVLALLGMKTDEQMGALGLEDYRKLVK
jgi:hypothetical protein